MEEMNEQVNNEESLGSNDQALENNSQADEQVDQPVDGTVQEQEYDFTKDERFERMWKKDPNLMYKSYRSLEDQYGKVKPIQDQYTQLMSKFESKGLKVDALDEYMREYEELKDPNNPKNIDYQILQDFMSDPISEQKLGNFFRELQTEKMQRMFPGMNQEQIQQQLQMKEELEALKKAEYQRQLEAKEKEFLSVINKNTEKMMSFAKERGLEITEEIKNDVLEHCAKNNIPANAILATFLEKYGDKLQDAWENKMRDNFTKNRNKTDKVAIPSATKSSKPIQSNSSEENSKNLRDKLRSIFN